MFSIVYHEKGVYLTYNSHLEVRIHLQIHISRLSFTIQRVQKVYRLGLAVEDVVSTQRLRNIGLD